MVTNLHGLTSNAAEGEIVSETWDGCRDEAVVTLYTIKGRGHNWPGVELAPGFEISTKDISATDAIWEFFATHPLP